MQDNFEEIDQPIEEMQTKVTPPSEKDARWMLDYIRLYWEITAHLYGGQLTQEKTGDQQYKIVRRRGAKQFMNDKGIEETMSIFNGFVNKIDATSLTNEDRILDKCTRLHEELAFNYFINMKRYELTREKASLVIKMIVNAFESNSRKSIGAIMLKTLGGSETVHMVMTEGKRGGGLMGKLGGF